MSRLRALRTSPARTWAIFIGAILSAGTTACDSATGDVLVSLPGPGSDAGGTRTGDGESGAGNCAQAIETLAVHSAVHLGGVSHRSGRNDVVFQDGNDTLLVAFDDHGALIGNERLLAQDLTIDSPRIAAGDDERLRIAFQDFRLAGKWRIYTQTIDPLDMTSDVFADNGIQASSDQAEESVGPIIASRGLAYGILYRADHSVAFATIGPQGDVSARELLADELPPPDILGLRATSAGYLGIAHRAGYELEWFGPDGSHVAAGPRITAAALDGTWIDDHIVVVQLQDGVLSLADLASGAANLGPVRPWIARSSE